MREHGLAHGADTDRRERDPDLARGDVLVDPVDLPAHLRRARRALVLECIQAVDARADQRVLRGHEERVERDQRGNAQEQQR